MKKIIFPILMMLTTCMLFISSHLKAGENQRTKSEIVSGNEATCYSTYQEPLIFGGSNIFVCGICKQAKATNWTDSGVCKF